LLSNSNNFGFAKSMKQHTNNQYKIKVIDFKIKEETDTIISKDYFDGFLVGNGTYNFSDLNIR